MNNFLILLLFIFFVCNLKWLIFFCSLLPIRLWNHRRSLKYSKKTNIAVSQKQDVSVGKIRKHSVFIEKALRYFLGFTRYADFQTGFIPSHHIRGFLYKKIWLVDMATNVTIYWGAEIRASYNLKIGQGSIIGDKSLLDARNGIEIGENVNFSSNVSIYTEQHDHRDPMFACNSDNSFKVRIGNRAWIGPNVVILPGVKIGEGAVVAAGSVVTKDIEEFTLVGGIPAKKIGVRNRDLKYSFKGIYSPFY